MYYSYFLLYFSFDKINEFYTRIPQKTNLDKSRLEALEGSLQRIHGEISEMLPRPWQCKCRLSAQFKVSHKDGRLLMDGWLAG